MADRGGSLGAVEFRGVVGTLTPEWRNTGPAWGQGADRKPFADTFYECQDCFAVVTEAGREGHNAWHYPPNDNGSSGDGDA